MLEQVGRCILINVECSSEIKVLVNDLKKYSDEIFNHSVSVAKVSVFIGSLLKLDKEPIQKIYVAGLLHDYGKLFVPKDILFKCGSLSDSEFKIMRSHVEYGVLALKSRDYLDDEIITAISEHHERIDGSGYPNHSVDISTIGKILAIADVYDALTKTRCYKNRCSTEYTLEQLRLGEGYEFDTRIAEIFIQNEFKLNDYLNSVYTFDIND